MIFFMISILICIQLKVLIFRKSQTLRRMSVPMSIVDAFTLNGQHFTGNPAAVCLLKNDDDITDETKQRIASEMNQITCFVANAWNKESNPESNVFTIRWFTPSTELRLCGSGTMASAAIVFHKFYQNSTNNFIKFLTKFNDTLEMERNISRETISMDFPKNDCKPIDKQTNPWIEDIIQYTLGPELTANHVIDIQYSIGLKYLVIRLKDNENLVSKVSPDFNQLLKTFTNDSVKMVLVTQKSNDDSVHFQSRAFGPWLGANEDPVCGSAHTVLAPYWKRQYEQNNNISKSEELVGQHLSKRGGVVICRVIGERVQLSGQTKTVVSGVVVI